MEDERKSWEQCFSSAIQFSQISWKERQRQYMYMEIITQ